MICDVIRNMQVENKWEKMFFSTIYIKYCLLQKVSNNPHCQHISATLNVNLKSISSSRGINQ